jgi:hypothetical protein
MTTVELSTDSCGPLSCNFDRSTAWIKGIFVLSAMIPEKCTAACQFGEWKQLIKRRFTKVARKKKLSKDIFDKQEKL